MQVQRLVFLLQNLYLAVLLARDGDRTCLCLSLLVKFCKQNHLDMVHPEHTLIAALGGRLLSVLPRIPPHVSAERHKLTLSLAFVGLRGNAGFSC